MTGPASLLPLSSEFKGWVLFSAVDKIFKGWEDHSHLWPCNSLDPNLKRAICVVSLPVAYFGRLFLSLLHCFLVQIGPMRLPTTQHPAVGQALSEGHER